MRRSIAVLALLTIAFPVAAAAGRAYTVTFARSPEGIPTKTFRVVASGDRLRVLHVDAPPGEGILWDVLLRTADSGVIALNSRNRTWYEADGEGPFALASSYLMPRPDGKVENLSVRMSEEPAGAGEHRYSGEVRYDVLESHGGYTVRITCAGTFTVTTTDAIPRRQWIGRILPRTRFYRDVDAELGAAEARIEGFPLRMSLDAKRTYEGGPPMADFVEVKISDVEDVAIDEAQFARPRGYREQEPVLGVPGVED